MKILRFFLTWPLSVVHAILFILILLAFHIPLVLGRLFGENVMVKILDYHCLCHLLNIRFTGARFTILYDSELPPNTPLILVSNHQSMYDIPLIMWNLRKRKPKFIAKIELARWIPSISFGLRNGGHLIINRSKGKHAITRIRDEGRRLNQECGTVSIFPEGTRAPNGEHRTFKLPGFHTLLESMPDAKVVPITLDGTGTVVLHKFFPIPFGTRILLHIHSPLSREERTAEDLLKACEDLIFSTQKAFRAGSHP
ncbi:MAG: 1-acyl-sn-glycerol-3-phosphate acyltransferase [Bdellovibrionales bacterium]|nr:1-acyl-sn-glycerol-3-phosphate acyltransferase [Bdellovibrionales bacterium]